MDSGLWKKLSIFGENKCEESRVRSGVVKVYARCCGSPQGTGEWITEAAWDSSVPKEEKDLAAQGPAQQRARELRKKGATRHEAENVVWGDQVVKVDTHAPHPSYLPCFSKCKVYQYILIVKNFHPNSQKEDISHSVALS